MGNSYDNTVGNSFEAIVVNSEHSGGLNRAQIFVLGVHENKNIDEENDLPWSDLEIEGASSKGAGTSAAIFPGQRVIVEPKDNTLSTWKIIKRSPRHEDTEEGIGGPSGGSTGTSSNPKNVSSVEAQPDDSKIPAEHYQPDYLEERSLSRVASAEPCKLIGTTINSFNNDITELKNRGEAIIGGIGTSLAELVKLANGLINAIAGYTPPKITIGINGLVDFTKDMNRYVDRTGGSIGNIKSVVQVDGWPAKASSWEYIIVDTDPDEDWLEITASGDMVVKKNAPLGIHVAGVLMGDKQFPIDWENIPTWAAIALGSHTAAFTITYVVVPDLCLLDFSATIDYMKTMFTQMEENFKVGPKYVSDLMPDIKFKIEPKGTAKARFGQLQVIAGASKKSVGIEMDHSEKIADWIDDAKNIGNQIK